jgi:hypothetical protein
MESYMRHIRVFLACLFLLLLGFGLVSTMAAQSSTAPSLHSPSLFAAQLPAYWEDPLNWKQQFVPDSQLFWDNSKHWTTNYGPAYRDTIEGPAQMLGCSTQFALCFHSGADPYPCTISPDGRSANCLCTVATQTNYTLITAILNYPVYTATVQACGSDGSACSQVGQAPVCSYLNGGTLIPGANVLSTYDPETHFEIVKAFASSDVGLTTCDKAPYAACMTAPCTLNSDGTANCKCPVFYGKFQLVGKHAQCSLGGDLVPSASYIPVLDKSPND